VIRLPGKRDQSDHDGGRALPGAGEHLYPRFLVQRSRQRPMMGKLAAIPASGAPCPGGRDEQTGSFINRQLPGAYARCSSSGPSAQSGSSDRQQAARSELYRTLVKQAHQAAASRKVPSVGFLPSADRGHKVKQMVARETFPSQPRLVSVLPLSC
jgi:hypothetical protein